MHTFEEFEEVERRRCIVICLFKDDMLFGINSCDPLIGKWVRILHMYKLILSEDDTQPVHKNIDCLITKIAERTMQNS
jgi:hypothetical protein